MRPPFLRRLLMVVSTLLVVSGLVFLLLDLAPGDPMSQLPPSIPEDVRAEMRSALGLDQPAPERYARWLWQMLVVEPAIAADALLDTDLAAGAPRILSWQTRAPVMSLIAQRLPQTLVVVGLAYLLGTFGAIALSIGSAARRGRTLDRAGTGLAAMGHALPPFFTAAVLIYVFAIRLEWLPTTYDTTLAVTGWDSAAVQIRQMILPVAVLSLQTLAQTVRYSRAAMLDALAQDYILTARAKGLGARRVLLGHALRNSWVPVLTVAALGAPQVFAGAIVTEQIFGVNGIGQLLIQSLQAGDLPTVQTVTMLIAVLIVLANLGADVLIARIDPRTAHA
ncbi:ABC transporter substrate-binding protein [Pelagivirga sediminicola]|uniref:ABC transporter substrate-binding protein n=1 Tax=Pelagivirga sediminicola TaxID=2170575 RepID=A0A2T7GBV0_9RHOB|nr:ABC transporter permease [Pelagivirga sediminicola]PVA11886.1 ABC transporter substrate-binding protein [Pelagivirga sediminicola]